MSYKSFAEEEKKKLEKEFSALLIQRINQAGGSLQFQHLSGVLQQARFEIRDAFGTTKSELMKFLKVHPKCFKIDSIGIVSVVTSFASDEFNDIKTDKSNISKETLTKIENGVGFITKLHPEFGVIQASEPFKTQVHFKSEAFNNNKDRLLTDYGLEVGQEVYFNAVYGHDDFDIKYRASEVWQKLYENDCSKHDKSTVLNNLEGEGVIKKISHDLGFITVLGQKNETVIFHKKCVEDCGNRELAKFLKVNDHVEFLAHRSDGDSAVQWQATVVKKKFKKNYIQSSSQASDKVIAKNRIENEHGKICTHSHGAIIKFGKNFSERADGDSSCYFLYGVEVLTADIGFEFSDGDEVFFDAIRTKSAPGWKAVLVWIGDKPADISKRIFLKNETNKFSDDKICDSSDISSICNNFSSKTNKMISEKEAVVTKQIILNQNKPFEHSVSQKVSQSDQKYKQNSKVSKSYESSFVKKINKKGENKPEKEKLHRNKFQDKVKRDKFQGIPRKKVAHGSELKNLSKSISPKFQPHRGFDEISSICDEDYDDHLYFKDDMSDISQDSFEDEDNQGASQCKKYLLKESYDEYHTSSPRCLSDSDETDMDNAYNEIKCSGSIHKNQASIKKFEDIDGEIINLYCKAAIVKSSHLQKTIDFVLNAFYLNGKSVEEQQVINLKEIIKVGDHVKFNCFEIIDDTGKTHQKVTIAWKGPKPEVYEMTPEEFINEYELSVTVKEESVSESLNAEKNDSQNDFDNIHNDEETFKTISSNSSDTSDDENLRQSRLTETEAWDENHEKNEQISDIHSKELLSEIIIQRLKRKGYISPDIMVDFHGKVAEIASIIQKHISNKGFNCSYVNEIAEEKSEFIPQRVCLSCLKKRSAFSIERISERDASVQTIITGGIVAQNENFMKKSKFLKIY